LDKAFFVNAVQRENAPSHEGRHGGCSEERGAGGLYISCAERCSYYLFIVQILMKRITIKEKSLCSLSDSQASGEVGVLAAVVMVVMMVEKEECDEVYS
jgi:hypothetical protein